MGRTKTPGCSHNKKASTYKSKRIEKGSTSTNQRSILGYFGVGLMGIQQISESGDNSLENLLEQKTKMRNKSSERETEREFIYLDWEQVNLSVNSSQNISAMLDTTFIEVS